MVMKLIMLKNTQKAMFNVINKNSNNYKSKKVTNIAEMYSNETYDQITKKLSKCCKYFKQQFC